MASGTVVALGLAATALPSLVLLAPAPSPQGAVALDERRGDRFDDPQRLLAEATVTLLPSRCAGAVVEDGRHVASVAHCVVGRDRVEVRLFDGTRVGATVAYRDEARDHVLLRLDGRAPVRPLPSAEDLPAPGAALLFASRPERPMPPQWIEVERLGRCPSLPGVEAALFTSLVARPGDSGSPLLDESGALAALVHGGARCHISTPTAGLGRVLHGG